MKTKQFIVYNTELMKCVSWITQSTGKIYYCVNPWKGNYFIKREYAQAWLDGNNLDRDKFHVIEFE